ncbi:6-bladed beta-propeller protein [Fodinibius roseus]|uniref:6-bladed beta-propeller protein n=1 Tax=Fodinibius roseus TaxID=1194090 RepID=A0A1M4SGG2_9BACT|nr:6-bladed beta-propeller [Fodinibius roseus]SHE31279.1 6-bladed beta-propeller protein [Fodinibius roseus]
MIKANSCYFIILLILLISCKGGDEEERGRIIHPKEEFFPSTKPYVSITDDNSNFSQSEATEYFPRLKSAKRAIKIGVEKGEREETFGEIKGVVSDSLGNVFILDAQHNKVRVFNKKGAYLFSFGGSGSGPGEFMSPADIDIGKDGRIYIADRYNAIKIFEPKDSGFEYLTTIKIHLVPDAFCILRDRLFIRGIGLDKADLDSTDFKIIHTYSADTGEYLYSFGDPYNSPNTMILKQLSDGTVACNEATETVVSTFDMMPYVFGYTVNGTLSWAAKIENFSQRPIIQGTDNSVSLKNTGSNFDSINSFISIAKSNWFLVQVVERPARRDVQFNQIRFRSYLVSSEDGSGGFLSSDLPILLFANRERMFANDLLNSSYPSVVIYNYD